MTRKTKAEFDMIHRAGITENPNKPPSLSAGCRMTGSPMGWALHWAQCGLRLFPCTKFTGLPLVPKWPSAASDKDSQIVAWWSELTDADIGAIPDSAGCFVLTAIGEEGLDNLDELAWTFGKPLLETEGADGSLHLWFPGRASSRRLADGLYVFGVGSYLYMPGSLAPDPIARFEKEAA